MQKFIKQQTHTFFRLAFIQLVCPSYKLPMFEGIRKIHNVELTLFIGDKNPSTTSPNGDLSQISSIQVKNKIIQLFGLLWIWQDINKILHPQYYNLIILSDHVLLLSNYIVMLRCWWNKIPFGLYTHGFNYQRKEQKWAKILEYFRAFIHRHCSVLIVYSKEGAQHLQNNNGVSPERIFIAPNTLDIESILKRTAIITTHQITQCRLAMGIDLDEVVLVYIGRIEPIKNPDWVIEVVKFLQNQQIRVHALLVGDGTQLCKLEEQISQLPLKVAKAIHLVGQVPVEQVDLYLKLGDITIMPGMTGLAIVHSFAVGRPYITIKSPYHSPEIAYLEHGINGLITEATLEAFCKAVMSLVLDQEKCQAMGKAALAYAKNNLSMVNQINGFKQAIDFICAQQQKLKPDENFKY
jgi:glycosyltransferase involved in cell wall biosynthesis